MFKCDIKTNCCGETNTSTFVDDNRLDDNERATPEPDRDNEEERSDDETIAEHDAQFATHHREPFGVRHRPHSPEEDEQSENVSATTTKPVADTTGDQVAFMLVLIAPFIGFGLLAWVFNPILFVK